MAEVAVQSAAMWLGKLLSEEIRYLDGVSGKVERLRTELNTLAAFLSEAVKSLRQDEVVRAALAEGRNVAYDCQDVIETYILEVARHGYEEQEGCQLGSAMRWACLLWTSPSVHQIGSKIDALNERISALKSSIISYVVPTRITNHIDSNPTHRRVYTHEREEYVVVGLEDHLAELGRRLLNPADRTVIVISGMGGVGKSTLARELYHHPKLRNGGQFQAFGWAPASQKLNADRVLQTVMYSLVPENDHERRRRIDQEIRGDRAHAALYKMMKGDKCLVVIDDIWTPDDWRKIEAAFPRRSATGSRVLLTTRNQDILSAALDPTQVHVHPIKGLDERRSWKLFHKTAFSGGTCTDPRMEELGRDMLRHCSGVPLAIVVLGKILKTKERVEDWKQMRNDIFAQIRKGGAPNNPYKEVYDVLQVSYDELPFHLKHCFLHFANFPEDHEIATLRLYQLWIAEGIVLGEQNPDEMEEIVAERYLKELVSRNMVQATSWVEGTERIKSCRLHDLMRDVCMDIAKREEFLQTVSCQKSMLFDKKLDHLLMTHLFERDNRLRRLSVNVRGHQEAAESSAHSTTTTATTMPRSISANVSRAPNLRSLLLFSVDEQQRSRDFDCK